MDLWTLTNDGRVRIDKYRGEHLSKELLLKEVTEEELLMYRASKNPGLVFVFDGKHYYCPIPQHFSLHLGAHQCSLNGKVCDHLSALPDEMGGCQKVKDFCIGSFNGRYTDLKGSKRIEKYTFIKCGFEIFNVDFEHLVVLKCSHYKPAPSPKSLN